MKNLKFIILALIVSMIIVVTGCARQQQDIISKAKASSVEIKNYDLDMSMDIAMNVMNQDVTMLMNMKSTNFIDPIKSKSVVSIDMGKLGKQETQSYVVQEGKVVKVYTGAMGKWSVQELTDLKNMEDALSEANFKVFLDNFSNFKEVGSDKIDGKDVVVYEGVIRGKSLGEVMKTSGMLESLQSDMTMDYDVVFGSDMGDMKVKFWIEKDTAFPVKYEMDMAEVMNRLMTIIYTEAIPGTDIKVNVSKCYVVMTMKNINNAEDFKIPDEVLNTK